MRQVIRDISQIDHLSVVHLIPKSIQVQFFYEGLHTLGLMCCAIDASSLLRMRSRRGRPLWWVGGWRILTSTSDRYI